MAEARGFTAEFGKIMIYHLSKDKNLKVLTPKIPECAVAINEDVKTKRVCFSDFIEGCLSSLQDLPNKYYVYVPDQDLKEADLHYPTVDEVRDAKRNHEVWIMKEVKVKCIGIIQTENYDWKTQHNTGRGRVTFFHYPYKWIEKREQ